MKQNFTILWIEDKEIVITSQIPEIKRFLDSEGFEMKFFKDTVGDKFKEIIEENKLIDLIVTDFHISEETNGTDVIKHVRDKGLLTDILFYSVHTDLFEKEGRDIYNELGHYGLIEILEGKDVILPIKELIKKNIKRCQDIVFLRGFVISQSIELELKLNEFFSKYFEVPEKQIIEFHNTILESSYVPMAGKKKWLSQILNENNLNTEFKGLLTKLEEISTKRNLLAHCKKDDDNQNVLISSGKEEIIDKIGLNRILEQIDVVSVHLDKLIEKLPFENASIEEKI